MRLTPLALGLCLLACAEATAKPTAPNDDIPRLLSVSEVSKDDHVIHNRLTFDCQAADGADPVAPKEITCIVVQQNLQEPSPMPSQEEWDKKFAEIPAGEAATQAVKTCQDLAEMTKKPRQGGRPSNDDLRLEAEYRENLAKPCEKKDNAAVLAALSDILRSQAERESHTCKMMTIPMRHTFAHAKKGVWVSIPDPFPICKNVKVTRALRRDPRNTSAWNYTEVTVATPSQDSFCQAESGTTEFTWRRAFTASELRCRFIEM